MTSLIPGEFPTGLPSSVVGGSFLSSEEASETSSLADPAGGSLDTLSVPSTAI